MTETVTSGLMRGCWKRERWAARGGHSPETGRNGRASHALDVTAPASYSTAASPGHAGDGVASITCGMELGSARCQRSS